MEDAVLKNVEPTQNILSNSGSLRAPTAWFAIISLALSVLSPGRSQAGVGVTTIFSFKGTNGRYPGTPLIQGPDGSFYGTAQGHFNSSGTVFNLTQSGELNTLATFDGTNGSGPVGPIVRTPDGSIYGTTYLGTNNLGSIYRVSPAGVIEPLFSFNGTNGASPVGLITGLDGAFYGSARYGGLGYSGSQVSGA